MTQLLDFQKSKGGLTSNEVKLWQDKWEKINGIAVGGYNHIFEYKLQEMGFVPTRVPRLYKAIDELHKAVAKLDKQQRALFFREFSDSRKMLNLFAGFEELAKFEEERGEKCK